MKKLLSFIAVMAINAGAYTLNIQPGWQMKGVPQDTLISELKNPNIKSIWAYDPDTKKWKAYIPNSNIDLSKYNIGTLTKIKKYEGFWINSIGYATIKTYDNIYNDDTYIKELIDKPVNFELSDIAGKTVKLINREGNLSTLTFNEKGESTFLYNNNSYNVKYENGVINFYDKNGFLKFSYKKIKEDSNGIVVLLTDYMQESNNLYVTYYLKGWLFINPTPIDISSLLPLTLYGSSGEYLWKLNSDNTGTVLSFDGQTDNCNLIDNNIVIHHTNGDNNKGWDWKKKVQIVSKIDRYYLLKNNIVEKYWYINSNLIGKTFDDIIGTYTSVSVNEPFYKNGYPTSTYLADYTLNSDGTIKINNTNTLDILKYEEINSTALKLLICDNDNNCWKYGVLSIDINTGKVTRSDSYYYIGLASKTPISNITVKPKEQENEGNVGGTTGGYSTGTATNTPNSSNQ